MLQVTLSVETAQIPNPLMCPLPRVFVQGSVSYFGNLNLVQQQAFHPTVFTNRLVTRRLSNAGTD